MKLLSPWLLLTLAGCWPVAAEAQLQVLPDGEPQWVFAGGARKISVTWYNAGGETESADIRLRLLQASSATAAPISERPWQKTKILPGQTVLESAGVDFPEVKAETSFLVQWLDGSNRVVGTTKVLVYPTNLLGELKTVMGENTLGVLDYGDKLKPLLKQNGVELADLEAATLDNYRGRLAILGPFKSEGQMREGLAQSIELMAQKGTAVVWLRPPTGPRARITPSYYIVPEGKGAVVVVQAELVADLSTSPKSQLNLVYFCKLALHPTSPALFGLNAQH